MNKFLFVLMVLMLVFAIADKISSLSSHGYLSPGIDPLKVAESIGLLLMLYNGTFRTTKFYTYFRMALFLLTLGVVMKVMHLAGADEVIMMPFPIVAILYAIHFAIKTKKTLLDYCKVLLVIVYLSITPLTVMQLIDEQVMEILLLANHVLFWITFTLFLYEEGYQKKALF